MIRLSKSCLSQAEKDAVLGVLDREYLGMGAEVRLFEVELTKYFERPATCVANGTAALHLALQAIGVGPGDEVLVQSLTYVASFQAISATGAVPIPCDVDNSTLTLDITDAERKISSRTKVIMPVHYAGGVGDIEGIYKLARNYNLRVVEDAAHAFGSKYKQANVGSFGDIACFSFDGIKNITSGEGGCIVTEDKVVLQKVKDARLLGVEKDTEKRFSGERSWEFDVSAQGWRYHMSNIMAAIGIEQLKRLNNFSEKRQYLAKLYDSIFIQEPKIKTLKINYDEVVPHIYIVIINNLFNKKHIQNKLLMHGIQTGTHYMPNHLLSFYSKEGGRSSLSNSEKIFENMITLPLHFELSDFEVEFISQKFIEVLNDK